MKPTKLLLLPLTLLSLTACLETGSNHRQDETGDNQVLQQNRAKTGRIASVGEVDWYEYKPASSASQLSIEVSSNTLRSDVELLATLYQEDDAGNLLRLYADHAPEGAVQGADIQINYKLKNDNRIFVSVRDLMDDEAATGDYRILVNEGLSDMENDVLEGAQELGVNGSCLKDRIDTIGDVDIFKFTLPNDSVAKIKATLNSTSVTPVDLQLSLYDGDTAPVERWSYSKNHIYSLQRYLTAGTYTLSIDDVGRNDFDLSALYTVCVETVDGLEAMQDDSEATANSVDLTVNDQRVNGTIGHQEDTDWFAITVPATSGNEKGLLNVSLEANNSTEHLLYQIKDSTGKVIFSYVHTAGSKAHTQQVLVGQGQHQMSVSLADGEWLETPADYAVSLQMDTVNDAAEVGDANNSQATATKLVLGTTETGKISYRGDLDWYEIEVTPVANEYQVLELALSSSDVSPVDYRMQVVLHDHITALEDPIWTDNILDLKKAFLVQPLSENDAGGIRRYFVKVSDVKAEKSDSLATYQLSALQRPFHSFDMSDLPDAVDGSVLLFDDETQEQRQKAANGDLIHLQVNGYATKVIPFDRGALKHTNPQDMAQYVTRTDNEDGTYTIQFPWLGGYIDYSGDQDAWSIDLKPLGFEVEVEVESDDDMTGDMTDDMAEDAEPETEIVVQYPDAGKQWHYQIQIELLSAAGESSEYQWRFYRDQGQNYVIRDRPTTKGDGYIALMGDGTLTTEAHHQNTAGRQFWTSEDRNEMFYFVISDFDYRTVMQTGATNPSMDEDWSGKHTPYFARITLTYVQGKHQP